MQISEHFAKPKSLGGKMTVELDLSNYATKANLKSATGVDALKLAKKVDLTCLKEEINKLDIGKLETNPVEDIKKEMYVELVKKVHAFKTTDTGDLVNTNQTEG